MKNLFSYKAFKDVKSLNEAKINEAKKKTSMVSLFKKDVKGILDDMFAQVKKPEYEFDEEGYPTKVEFEINDSDFGVSYSDLKCEFSEGVANKRDYEPVLVFDEKEEEGKDDKKYKISFKIKKEKTKLSDHKERPITKDSDKQLKDKLKDAKVSDSEKEKIMDILKDRGVEYKNPFDDEDDDKKSDEDKAKEAEKAAKKKEEKEKDKKKNESVEETEENEVNEGFLGKVAKFLSKKEYVKTLDHVKSGLEDDFTKEDVEKLVNGMVFSKITKKGLKDDKAIFKSLVDELYKDCKKETKNESIETEKIDDGKCEKCDCEPCECDPNIIEEKKEEKCECEAEKEKKCDCETEVNEGFMGKIAKILSKKEYDKTVEYVKNNCEDITKETVKDCLSNMVFSKITKKALKEDSKLMNSLVDEIVKDCKKETKEVKESIIKFGSPEWNKKFGVEVKEDEKEVSLNELVNETVKIKKVEYKSLNETINQVYLDNEVIPSLKTFKKGEDE